MSTRGLSARSCALAVLVAIALPLTASAAQAASPQDICAAFPHRQTYVADGGMFRAPAWHYDKTVTVVYETSSCSANVVDSGNYVLSISGTATIYQGLKTGGEPLDTRPFTSVIRSNDANGKLGWPISWWSCFKGSFSYVWTIQNVYSFAVTAHDGRWLMSQRDPTSGESTMQSFNGCRAV